jgi:hypothetical protein
MMTTRRARDERANGDRVHVDPASIGATVTWVRIDDVAVSHPKLVRARLDGVGLWLAGLCFCNRHGTDGVIEKAALPALYPLPPSQADRLARRLVDIGLWLDEGTHYRVHNYDRYQAEALSDAREARREAARLRKQRERQRKKQAQLDTLSRCDTLRTSRPLSHGQGARTRAVTGAVTDPATDPATGHVAPAEPAAEPVHGAVSQPPGPARPDPSSDSLRSSGAGVPEATDPAWRVIRIFEAAWAARHGTELGLASGQHGRATSVWRWAAKHRPADPASAVAESATAFAALRMAQEARQPFALYAATPGNWRPSNGRTGAVDGVRLKTPEEVMAEIDREGCP